MAGRCTGGEEFDAEEILPSTSELATDISRCDGPATAEFELLGHSCNFGTEDSSSDEIGIKSGQVIKEDLEGEGACGLTLIGTSGIKFSDVEEEAVRPTTSVASRKIGRMPGA